MTPPIPTNRPLRLCYSITAYPPAIGGGQLHAHALLSHMVNCQVDVVSLWDHNRSDWLLGTTIGAPGAPRSYVKDDIRVHCLGLSRRERWCLAPAAAAYYPAMNWAAPRLARPFKARLDMFARDADLVHAVRMGREGLALASEAAARDADRPFVFTPLHHPRWTGWRHRPYAALYRRSDALVALTNAEAETLVGLGVDPDKITVTGVGPVLADAADPDAFRADHHVDGAMVLFLGQHFRYKGWPALLDAAPLVWHRFPDTKFVFVGPPVGRSEQVFRHRDPRIIRMGAVDLQTKTNALAACDILCVPSTQESFGMVFTEAWAFDKPVIGGKAPAVGEVVAHGTDGFIVSQEPRTIADQIVTLLEDPSLARKMGALGHKKVEEHYSWTALAARTQAVYRRLM